MRIYSEGVSKRTTGRRNFPPHPVDCRRIWQRLKK